MCPERTIWIWIYCAGDHPCRNLILHLSSLWTPVSLHLGLRPSELSPVHICIWNSCVIILDFFRKTLLLRFNWCSFPVISKRYCLYHRYPSSLLKNCFVHSSIFSSLVLCVGIDQLLISITVSICCKRKLLWWWVRATLIWGYKDKDLENRNDVNLRKWKE